MPTDKSSTNATNDDWCFCAHPDQRCPVHQVEPIGDADLAELRAIKHYPKSGYWMIDAIPALIARLDETERELQRVRSRV